MTISVIIPVFNDLVGLKNTLLAMEQQMCSCQVVVKDGYGCALSEEFIKHHSFKFLQIEYIKRKDRGIYHAINQALEFIKGTHVIIVGCGDIPQLKTIYALGLKSQTVYVAPVLLDNGVSQALYKGRLTPPHQGIIYCAEVYKKLKYNINYKIISDRIFYDEFEKLFSYPVFHTTDPICTFLLNGISSSNSSKKIIFKEMLQYFWFVPTWRNFLRLSSSFSSYLSHAFKT